MGLVSSVCQSGSFVWLHVATRRPDNGFMRNFILGIFFFIKFSDKRQRKLNRTTMLDAFNKEILVSLFES